MYAHVNHKKMQSSSLSVYRIFQVSEEFFTSLGLKPIPAEFWRYSMIIRPEDRPVICKSSAWDFCNRKDYRFVHKTSIVCYIFLY